MANGTHLHAVRGFGMIRYALACEQAGTLRELVPEFDCL